MFPYKNRIRKDRDFENIFKNGKTIKSGFFKIVFLKNNLNINRFAVVINKKASKSAFLRNKIKRIIKNELQNVFIKNRSLDMVLIVFPNIKENIGNIKNEINKLPNKINLY